MQQSKLFLHFCTASASLLHTKLLQMYLIKADSHMLCLTYAAEVCSAEK